MGFLCVAFLALQQLYPILKVTDEVQERLGKLGLILTIGMVGLTILITIIFVIMASNAFEWDLGTSFYGSIFGGLLSVLFLWLARRIETPAK